MGLRAAACAAAILLLFLAPTGLVGQLHSPVIADSVGPEQGRGEQLAAAPPAIDTMALRAHTRFLADDILAGRGTGTAGERIAALYIGSQLMRLGVPGAASGGGYFQAVPIRRARVDTAGTTLSIQVGESSMDFSTPGDFLVGTGGEEAFESFAGEAVFVGDPGAALATMDRADELAGSTVVVLGTLGEAALQLVPRWIEAGVAGVISLIPDPQRFDLFTRSRGESRYYVTVDVQDPIWQPNLPMLLAGPAVADVLLDEVGTLDSNASPPGGLPMRLGKTIRSAIAVEREDVETANVVGLLPGSDPALRDQVLVYTAHHDHLGISTPDPAGDSIYNGFSDNAAGTAMVLAIADALRREPPARSVLFLFLTGEERGLLGSSYFAAEPPLPLERIIGVVNLDAGAPPAPPRTWRIAGGTDSPLGSIAGEVAEENGWEAGLSPASPNSDYWPFLVRGIPSIFIIPGGEWEGVDGQEQAALRERWDHYHRASDHWAADFPFSGLRRYADFALQVGLRVANAETAAPR